MDVGIPLVNARRWSVIADLDGTLIDSETTNFKALNQILEEFNIAEHKDTIFTGLAEGDDFSDIMLRISLTEKEKEIMEKRMVSLLTQAPIPSLPGVVNNLRFLWGLGIQFCLATDNYSQFVSKALHELDLMDVFDPRFILTCDTFEYRKPSSMIVTELLKRSGRERAIIIGNSPKEIAMARNAGCPAIIISSGRTRDGGRTVRKETFDYEWRKFGGMKQDFVTVVDDWSEASERILHIVNGNGRRGPI